MVFNLVTVCGLHVGSYTYIDRFNFCNCFGPSTKKSKSENIFQFFYLFVLDIVFVQFRRTFFVPHFMFGYKFFYFLFLKKGSMVLYIQY